MANYLPATLDLFFLMIFRFIKAAQYSATLFCQELLLNSENKNMNNGIILGISSYFQ